MSRVLSILESMNEIMDTLCSAQNTRYLISRGLLQRINCCATIAVWYNWRNYRILKYVNSTKIKMSFEFVTYKAFSIKILYHLLYE